MKNLIVLFCLLFFGCTSNKWVSVTSEKIYIKNVKGKTKKARKLTFVSTLPHNADTLFREYLESSFMMKISKPKGILKPKKHYQIPKQWSEAQTDSFNLKVQGFVPMGSHFIYWERIDKENLTIQTREKGGFVKVWDCYLKIIPLSDSTCLYRDEIIIRAGILTGFTSLWARDFYKFRHKNLRKLKE